MDLIRNVFTRLDIDETIFIQFAISVILFFILNSLFFKKILFVLQFREDKTVKLEDGANEKLAEFETLVAKYKTKVNRANKDIQSEYEAKKTALVAKEKTIFKGEEKLILDKAAIKHRELVENVEEVRKDIGSKKAAYTSELLKKLLAE